MVHRSAAALRCLRGSACQGSGRVWFSLSLSYFLFPPKTRDKTGAFLQQNRQTRRKTEGVCPSGRNAIAKSGPDWYTESVSNREKNGGIFLYRNGIKRLLAIVLSLCGMIVLSWLFLILAVAIKLDSPGPVFFKQKRVGKGRRHFYILKFRTMRIDTPHDMPTHLLRDPDQYITRMGHFLRRTSLDELPQLWNIFVGDMAVIGPRPALWNQYDLLDERDKYGANDVRPGLTGWAQIHGRDELEIAEKARLDGWYVEHLGFALDVKCFFGTIAAVLKHDGVVEGGTGTIHEEKKEK